MSESIDDDEVLYRRIPASMNWYDPETDDLSADAFRPHRSLDTTGLSLTRAQSESHPEFLGIEDAARGRSPHGYFVAILRAGDLREKGIEIVSCPEPDNLGHVELPQMNAGARNSDRVLEWKEQLAKYLTREVCGPFHDQSASEP